MTQGGPVFTISKILRAPETPEQKRSFIQRRPDALRAAMRRAGEWLQRNAVNGMALVALAVVALHLSHEFQPSVEKYAGAVSDLSLAILAAWIFNLVIVELPRRRAKEQLYTGIAWMVGLMANSGIRMVEFLSGAAGHPITTDPQVGGVIAPANREETDVICRAIGPTTPYAPIPGAHGCWDLIRGHIEKAKEFQAKLQPWMTSFEPEVLAAMNAVSGSQLALLVEDNPQIANITLENLSEEIYDHWKACDHLMAVHYALVQPYVSGWMPDKSRRKRRKFTPQMHGAIGIENARRAIAERDAAAAAESSLAPDPHEP